ncbi:Hypothetical predicted protein [Cloeon dipterum]|uniref:Reverse transcriptase domain-containing protein n=3 Tax=Cloeon dipterum TaxID=197152 RepID=A0A8S1E3M9_9INSE|nr:Hypothetical predicted protein [Cloeon dipterum]
MPSKESLQEFWAGIWSEPKEHDEGSSWIGDVKEKCEDMTHMEKVVIGVDDVSRVIKKSHNWKAPGHDAMNPLSMLINDLKCGYKMSEGQAGLISHQLYLDDLKLYAGNKRQLKKMLEVVEKFSDTIKMEFGLDKCAAVHVRKGKVVEGAEVLELLNGEVIDSLEEGGSYKYLGMQQLLQINSNDVRKLVEKKVLARVRKVCKTYLSGRSKIAAINSWAIPVAVYSFGVLKWSKSSLQALDRKIRVTLTKFRLHHPRSSIQRLYIPRKEGGRGLLCLEVMCARQCEQLRHYFVQNRSEFVEVIQEKNLAFGALDLASVDLVEFPLMSLEDRKQEWRGKELHGRFLRVLESQNVDKEWSTEWLRTSGIFGETEGFILSIQDEVISTRGYQRHVMHQDVSDRCRLCRVQNESIQHVCGGCSVLAPREYLERHNNVAKVVHQALAKNLKLQEEEQPYYRCKPPQVMEAGGVRLLWDSEMVTDRAVEANRPDIVVIDQRKKEGLIIDIAVPLDANVERTVVEKKRKYQPLAVELKEIYNLRKITVAPVVISTNGVVLKDWKKLMETLPLTTNHLKLMQKAAVLGTANIVRKTLAL